MTTPAKSSAALPLVAILKACPAHDNGFSEETLSKTWERFKQQAWKPDDELTPAVMAGLILHDKQFAHC